MVMGFKDRFSAENELCIPVLGLHSHCDHCAHSEMLELVEIYPICFAVYTMVPRGQIMHPLHSLP